jgi:hypothetical protein
MYDLEVWLGRWERRGEAERSKGVVGFADEFCSALLRAEGGERERVEGSRERRRGA